MTDLNALLIKVVNNNGTALHLTVGESPKMRVDGAISALQHEPIDATTMERMLELACPERSWLNFLEEHDLDFAYEIPGHARFRANYLYDHLGPAAVFKVIPSRIMTLDGLNVPPVLKRVCEARSGLTLVTGPMGSGTSTTLAAMIDYVNETTCKHIVAIENPIEFLHPNKKSIIVHREIGQHSDSFSAALHGAMRTDPDIILIGEMVNAETFRLALTCASMGILVFGSMQTPNAIRTLSGIIDSFPADEQPLIRTLLADSLSAVVSQMLCKTINGGVVAAHEILLKNDAVAEAIRHGKLNNLPRIIEAYSAEGMQSINTTLKELVENGTISGEEAYRKAADKKPFRHLLNQGHPLRRQSR